MAAKKKAKKKKRTSERSTAGKESQRADVSDDVSKAEDASSKRGAPSRAAPEYTGSPYITLWIESDRRFGQLLFWYYTFALAGTGYAVKHLDSNAGESVEQRHLFLLYWVVVSTAVLSALLVWMVWERRRSIEIARTQFERGPMAAITATPKGVLILGALFLQTCVPLFILYKLNVDKPLSHLAVAWTALLIAWPLRQAYRALWRA